MVDVKTVNASDNPDPDQVEAQRERDRAELRRQQGAEGEAASTSGNRGAVDEATRQGRGPAGLNRGPSDTVSADPHRPLSNAPLYGNQPINPRSEGMGQSPPAGPAPTSDKPEPYRPEQTRADQLGQTRAGEARDPAAADAAEKQAQEERQARLQSLAAEADRREAEKRIAENQPDRSSKP